jgi:anti-sigma factor ChrR (cupin superfamily)
MGLFLTCEHTTGILSDFSDGLLPLWRATLVKAHLRSCPACRTMHATLTALPLLAGELRDELPEAAEAALAGALAHIRQHGEVRPWPATAVPEEALDLLEREPDLPLAILAAAHRTVAGARSPEPGPYHLPKGILDRLPPEDQWAWVDGANGRRRVELLKDPRHGQKLILAYAPTGVRSQAHRHLGTESILILAGTMQDGSMALTAGDWVHHPMGSVHAPEIRGEDCWCLIREDGGSVAAGPLERLRLRAR